MDIKEVGAAVEAMLFASGEPVSVERLAQALETEKSTIQNIISILMEKWDNPSFGIEIIKIENSYQMITKREHSKYVKFILDTKRNIPLSNAAMETLAIIAYNQPVTKSYIEKVRGVDSSGIVSLLDSKGLIEERARLDVPGRPISYGTTLNFLRCFGLRSINDLPPIETNSDPAKEAEKNEKIIAQNKEKEDNSFKD